MIYESERAGFVQFSASDVEYIKSIATPGKLTQKLMEVGRAALPYFKKGPFPKGVDVPVDYVIARMTVMESHEFNPASDVCTRCGIGRMVIFNNGTACTPPASTRKVAAIDDFDTIRAARDRIKAEAAEGQRLADERARSEDPPPQGGGQNT